MGSRSIALLTVLAALSLWTVTPTAGAAAGLRTGFADPSSFEPLSRTERDEVLRRARAARGSIVRVFVSWGRVAPTRPPGRAAARDGAWSGYDWRETDRAVREAGGAGMRVLLTVSSAPAWAEGGGRPSRARAPLGTWKPSPRSYGDFMSAVARRYSGRTPDPARPGALIPRVRYFQAWNEPNLSEHLAPQYVRRRGRLTAFSPAHYRRLLNALYNEVKRASRRNVVVTAGTAPFGDRRRGGRRIPPAAFVRRLFCVRGAARPRPYRCTGSPARFDVLAHHPFSIFEPFRRAFNRDDVSPPDLAKLKLPLSVARRAGTVSPRRRRQLWVTEAFYGDSAPPDPDGIPQGRHARFLEGTLFVLWRQGVDVALWLQVRDSAPVPSFGATLQTGLYERGAAVFLDRPKPALTAFRFPFTAYRRGGGAALWGIAPRPGPVAIEALGAGGWVRLTTLRAGGNRVFFKRTRVRRGTLLRARQAGEVSLTWRT